MDLFYSFNFQRSYFFKALASLSMMILSLVSNAQLTENFSGTTFPPSGWTLYNDPNYTPLLTKRLATVNGYGTTAGQGAIYLDFWNANVGTKDSLTTPTLNPTLSGDSLIFDHIHATASGQVNHDSMAIYTSLDDGITWSRLIGLKGDPANIGCSTCMSTFPGALAYEMIPPINPPIGTNWMTKRYALPVGTNKIVFVFYSNYGENLFLDNITVSRNLPMVYSDAVASQASIDTVFDGMNNAAVINAQILAINSASPLLVTSLTANTSGTTNVGDILRAKLYYSGAAGFNVANASLLATVNNPSGSMVFTGFSQPLAGSLSNFWIVYDVAPTAIEGNVLDGTFTSVTVDGIVRTPSVQNPAGNRFIQNHKKYRYCQWNTLSTINYLSGPTNVSIGAINNTTADLNQLTSYASQSTSLYKGDSAQLFVTIGPGNTEQVAVFVDWNNNGLFELPDEKIYYATGIPGGGTIGLPIMAPVSTPCYIKVPCTATPGFHRFRVISDLTGTTITPCGPITYGDGEDYSLEVKEQPTPIASFGALDTFYTNGVLACTNTSIGTGLSSQWDFNNDGTYDAVTKNGAYQYTSNGTYFVKLKITSAGCLGVFTDSIVKKVVIISPPAITAANFISDRNVVSPGDVVNFFDLSTYGAGSWSWYLSPSNVGGNPAFIYVNGTSSASQNPQIVFNEYGKFTVTLTATNLLGTSSITKSLYINCVHSINMCGNGTAATISDDAGFLYDDGGKFANYTKGKNCSLLIKPGCASQIQLKFKMFDISTLQWSGYPAGGDWIKVYDGSDASGVPLHSGINWPAGIQNQAGNIPWLPPTLTATSGAMYIVYWTTGVGGQKGFEAEWSSTPVVGNNPPSASFNVPDTIYTGVANTYMASTSATVNSYDWDFNNDGIYDASGATVAYQYNTPTTVTVKLLISSCQGATTLTKVVTVMNPSVPPTPAFNVNFKSGTPLDVFQFFDASKNGPTSWQWTISPATYNLTSGNLMSQNLSVKFTAVGLYTIKLKVANSFGEDSITKTTFINVFYYCTPNVNMLDPDIGISNIIFQSINNTTPQGLAAYTDYSSLGTLNVELGALYPITIKRTSNTNAINRKVWIDLNGNGTFTDASENLFEETNSTTLSVTGNILIPKTATLGNSRLRIGVNAANSPNLGCGANYFGEYEDYRINIVPDITKPVITLIGTDTVYVEAGYVYNDLGATASDNVTSPQTFTTTYVGFTNGTAIANAGIYTVNYSATDSVGNQAITKVRKVIVTPDVTKPIITMNGLDTIVLAVGSTFTDPGASATDYYYGPVTPILVVGVVNTNLVGTYTLVYNATDLHGNAGISKIRKVIVIDTIAPIITVSGANPFYWNVHVKPFVDPGISATDNYCTSGLNIVSSAINLDSLGTYTINYTLKDCNGNVAVSKSRTVIVQDTIKPTLQFTFNTDTFLIDVLTLTTLPEPGYTLFDNYYTSSQLAVTKAGIVNLNVIGSYPVTYVVKDPSMNTSKVYTRIFKVVDRVKPVITLIGSTIANTYRWKTYNDSGATVTDNYYSNLVVSVSGVVDVNLPGIYYIAFNVSDPSGNAAIEKQRIVNVKESFGGFNDLSFEASVNIYPNPNNGKFTLVVNRDKAINLKIVIYDMLGNQIKDLTKDEISSGIYNFDMGGLAAGNYMIQFVTDQTTTSKKLTIIRK